MGIAVDAIVSRSRLVAHRVKNLAPIDALRCVVAHESGKIGSGGGYAP